MSLALRAWVDHTHVRPHEKGRCSIALEIEAVETPSERERPAARTVLALDVSGSMKGEPLAQVVASVDRLLDALGPEDELGIVAFADGAMRVVEPVRVDASGKRLVRSRAGRLQADGNTNIEAGLDLAAAMMAGRPSGSRCGVVLLSDGAPNVGAHTSDTLRAVVRRHRPHVSFFSLGYGVDHCEDVLASVGEAGGGGYEFVPDPTACLRSFAHALGVQGDVVVSDVELVIAPADGVELVRFVGREETRFSREGVVVSLADMVAKARRIVVAELSVRAPGADRFFVNLVEVTARWRSARERRASATNVEVKLEVLDRAPLLAPDAARRVILARADEVRASARARADLGQFGAASASIRMLLAEIELLPDWIPNDGTPLAEAYELLIDEAVAFERRPAAEAYAAFRKTAVSSRLAASRPSAAKSRGEASQKLIAHVAGDCPAAWLVRSDGGVRHPLREECVIGRTNEADICVPNSQVSRRHAEVFANAGDYWLSDLGSTNPTLVNGRVLGQTPHKLRPGDVVDVGDVRFEYEEGPRK